MKIAARTLTTMIIALAMIGIIGTATVGVAMADDGVEVSIGNVYCNDTIPITISNATNVGSVQLTLSYNSSVVNVTAVTRSDMDMMDRNLNETGQVQMIAWQNTSDGLNVPFNFTYITFDSVGIGTCPLNITNVTITGDTFDANLMTNCTNNGTYATYNVAGNGDANDDGHTDSGDVMVISKYLASKSGFGNISGFDTINDTEADYNGDGNVSYDDVRLLARCLIGIPGNCTSLE